MEQEFEDIKKLEAVLREERSRNLQEDFEDVFNYNISDVEERLEGYESDSSLNLENITEDKLHIAESNYLDIDCINFSKSFNSIKHYLSAEEIRLINSCKDNKLKHLLLLNRAKNIHLRGVLYKLYISCKEVREHIIRVNEETKATAEKESSKKRILLNRIGYPYFKVKQRFSCAPNEDAIRKKAAGEICLDYISGRRRWTVADQITLRRAVCYQYTCHKTKETEDKIAKLTTLQNNINEADKKAESKEEINKCQALLLKLEDSNSTHVPPLQDNVKIDWRIISQQDMAGRHTTEACNAMWNMYLHPSINKSKWIESEKEKLNELAEEYQYQDWEEIAKDLGTNRTAFTVFIHYRTTQSELCKGKFEPQEDEQLLRAVEMCRIANYIPWSKVAQHFTNRDRSQLYNRYTTNLKIPCQKKGSFSEEEDVLLMILVRKFGLNFTIISNYIPYRNRMQLSHRYNNYLNYEEVQNSGWSLSDDSKIITHVRKYGAKNWQELVDQIPKRNGSHFRHRYMHLQRWLSIHQGKGIEDVPRKSEGKPKQNNAYLRRVADMFDTNNEVPSLGDIKEKLKNNGRKRGRKPRAHYVNQVVDDELLQYFQSTQKLKTARQITSSDMSSICSTMKSILAIMNVTLDVPQKDDLIAIPTLDHLDKEILLHLFENVYTQCPRLTSKAENSSGKENVKIEFKLNNEISLLPPNINTLVGMRGMLLKYNGFKSKLTKAVNASNFSEAKDMIGKSLTQKVNEYDETMRKIIIMQQEDLNIRLRALFKWPAIMSLVQPEENLIVITNTSSKPTVPRKVGRPKKDTSKIDLMNKRRLMKRSLLSKTDNHQSNHTEDQCTEDVALIETCSRKLNATNENHQNQAVISVTTECDALDLTNVSDADTADDICTFPRKKMKLQESINEQLHEDIRKLDGVLLVEMQENDDIY